MTKPGAVGLWIAGLTVVHGVAPWLNSLVSARYGWSDRTPAAWNRAGLLLVFTGFTGLVWVLVMHLMKMPQRVAFDLTPAYLLQRGPYRFTRNPMYVAVLLIWSGWAIYYGSLSVLAACAFAFLVSNYVFVPREERTLQSRFGEEYRRYQTAVPRWLGRGQRDLRLKSDD